MEARSERKEHRLTHLRIFHHLTSSFHLPPSKIHQQSEIFTSLFSIVLLYPPSLRQPIDDQLLPQ